jgi:phosphoribosylformylglycinamidine cyclo-ligase
MKYRVDIDSANKAKNSLSGIIDGKDNRLINKVGAFSSLFQLDISKYKQPVLVLKTEEPGSKQVLAFKHDKIESVCYDMINHLINDCICMGAEPVAVQDLIICGTMDPAKIRRIVSACADACLEQGCVLTGGETTQQPDVVPEDTYVLGSSIVGIVEKDNIIDGSAIAGGDVVIGIGSNGLHTNGYTLVRDLITKNPKLEKMKIGSSSFIDTVLIPHKCYYRPLKSLFNTGKIKGLAHITGGGIKENLNRILPAEKNANIDLNAYKIPEIFACIKSESGIADEAMLRTFNMGIGMALVCDKNDVDYIINNLAENGEDSYIIGEISAGEQNVVCTGGLNY